MWFLIKVAVKPQNTEQCVPAGGRTPEAEEKKVIHVIQIIFFLLFTIPRTEYADMIYTGKRFTHSHPNTQTHTHTSF